MESSGAFTSFAKASAYKPPPDHGSSGSLLPPQRPVLQAHQSSNFVSPASSQAGPSMYGSATSSYQAGGIPSWSTSAGRGGGGHGYDAEVQEEHVNEWQTRFGWRTDVVAASAYILGPISALILLILETHSDYIRFHSYQSALLTTPLILFRLFLGLVHFPHFLLIILNIIIIGAILFMAFRAYRDANEGDLTRYHLPVIGDFADRWVGDE
ncbi:hypothetical protein FRB96_008965 [Tulasnella sp. 330]|nr:hypothetical protein FRB96_008965 [Tulasnella sp. 330]KAG8874763.1 hypothetical protein FRB97_005664 [Tulasnella sp. 331]KAG8879657.1 hypothetical protein FRB98_005584 [Tulasnella sp. 332]